MADALVGPHPFFVVHRNPYPGDLTGRWAYIDKCPHGFDMGAIHLGPALVNPAGATWAEVTWQFEDLGNGRCRISPSILARAVHDGQDCHFGPGEFEFMWLEDGELRNREPFASRYTARTGRAVKLAD